MQNEHDTGTRTRTCKVAAAAPLHSPRPMTARRSSCYADCNNILRAHGIPCESSSCISAQKADLRGGLLLRPWSCLHGSLYRLEDMCKTAFVFAPRRHHGVATPTPGHLHCQAQDVEHRQAGRDEVGRGPRRRHWQRPRLQIAFQAPGAIAGHGPT